MAYKMKGSPLQQTRAWVHGQETGWVKKNKKGENYTIIGEGDSDLDPGDKLYGDTLIIPKEYKYNILDTDPSSGRKDLKDLDYDIEKIGPKKHKISGGHKWTKEIKEKAEESMRKASGIGKQTDNDPRTDKQADRQNKRTENVEKKQTGRTQRSLNRQYGRLERKEIKDKNKKVRQDERQWIKAMNAKGEGGE